MCRLLHASGNLQENSRLLFYLNEKIVIIVAVIDAQIQLSLLPLPNPSTMFDLILTLYFNFCCFDLIWP